MALTTVLTFNVTNLSASVEGFNNGTLTHKSTFVDGVVYSDAISSYTISYNKSWGNHLEIKQWMKFIIDNFNISTFPQSNYLVLIKKGDNKVTMGFELDGSIIIDGDFWNKNSGKITHNPRPEMSCSWGDYVNMIHVEDRFYKVIQDFDKT